jgi:hypothetical protein
MLAYQASACGGEIGVRMAENSRVELTGDAVVVFKGDCTSKTLAREHNPTPGGMERIT